jgi:hypothetical protein
MRINLTVFSLLLNNILLLYVVSISLELQRVTAQRYFVRSTKKCRHCVLGLKVWRLQPQELKTQLSALKYWASSKSLFCLIFRDSGSEVAEYIKPKI